MKICTLLGVAALIPLLTGGCGVGGMGDDAHAMEDEELVGAFNFLLEIDGVNAGDQKTIIGGFKSMSGMDSETEVVEFLDDDNLIRKRPGRTTYANIVLKRGYTATDDLWQWRKQIEDGNTIRRNGAIVVRDETGTEVVRYEFFEAWPVKWSVPDHAAGSSVLIEQIVLAVERVERRPAAVR